MFWRLGAHNRATPSRYGVTAPGLTGGSVGGDVGGAAVTGVVAGGEVAGGDVSGDCAMPSVVGVLSPFPLLELLSLLLLSLLCERRRFVDPDPDPESELEPELP